MTPLFNIQTIETICVIRIRCYTRELTGDAENEDIGSLHALSWSHLKDKAPQPYYECYPVLKIACLCFTSLLPLH